MFLVGGRGTQQKQLCIIGRSTGFMSGEFIFFQGQGIVREFCDVSGKNEILQ